MGRGHGSLGQAGYLFSVTESFFYIFFFLQLQVFYLKKTSIQHTLETKIIKEQIRSLSKAKDGMLMFNSVIINGHPIL